MMASGLAVVWLFIMVCALSAQPADPEPGFASHIDSGLGKLEAGSYNAALTVFLDGLEKATQENDPNWQTKFLFYAGLASYQHALQLALDPKRRETLFNAAGYYQRLLEIQPRSGSALNNLAQVHLSLGNTGQAAQYFKAALDVGDDRQGFYALNLADLYKSKGDTDLALQYARLSAKLQPASLEAHQMVVELYRQRKDTMLIDYLWGLIQRGAVNRSQQAALDAIAAEDLPEKDDELLILVTTALAFQHYDPARFADTDAGKSINDLRSQPHLKQPIDEIYMLHWISSIKPGQSYRPPYFEWWQARKRSDNSADVSGRAAFRWLAVSLARWWRYDQTALISDEDRKKNNLLAERYYKIAIDLGSHNADPEAFLELADLYVNTGRSSRLKELSRTYERSLYRGKAEGYQERNWYNIYKFHSALGFMYAHLKQWVNKDVYYASATFQLSNALSAAEQYNRHAAGDRRIAVPPQIPALLSKAYLETHNNEAAVQTAVDYAERYLAEGRPDKAVQTLNYIQESQKPLGTGGGLEKRYIDLINKTPEMTPNPFVSKSRTIELKSPYMRGEDVRRLQTALSNRGVDIHVDGQFGPMSKKALERFQADAGLPVTGIADADTLDRLGIE
jgi:tetratricopeptide (TPR) repeat protein